MAERGKKGDERGMIKMNRMDKVFRKMKETGEKILILYFPIGDPIMDDCVEWADKYFKNGCTVLEIGLPYENPVLDGKTVQESMERAREKVTLEEVFQMIADIRKRCPQQILQIMTYHGNILKYGYEKFAEKCSDADVDGVLTPDATKEQLHKLDEALGKYGIYNLRFVPYHLTAEVMEEVRGHMKGGYIFQQAVDGGTGQQAQVSSKIKENVDKWKELKIPFPVCAGFGISDAKQVKEALAFGPDGVIVGSATISNIKKGEGEAFIASLREAADEEI